MKETRSGPRRLVKTWWIVPSSRSATIARPFASNHSFAGDALPIAQSPAIARSQAIAPLHVARDKKIPATYALPDPWIRHDEWYSFRKAPQNVHVLVTMGKSSGKGDAYHPLVWYHSYDGGRAFYIALGHTNESYSEPDFLKLLLGGIEYAIDGNKKLNYRKAHTQTISTAP